MVLTAAITASSLAASSSGCTARASAMLPQRSAAAGITSSLTRYPPHNHQRRQLSVCSASNNNRSSPASTTTTTSSSPTASTSSSSSSIEDEEARIEAIEAASRKGRSKTAARRQIPIRNMTPRQPESAASTRAEWKKGKLFPEGWEQMDAVEKVTELYLGQRGMLFWATELAWKGAIVLGVAWVLFRIGGAVGLYQLQGDLMMPPV